MLLKSEKFAQVYHFSFDYMLYSISAWFEDAPSFYFFAEEELFQQRTIYLVHQIWAALSLKDVKLFLHVPLHRYCFHIVDGRIFSIAVE